MGTITLFLIIGNVKYWVVKEDNWKCIGIKYRIRLRVHNIILCILLIGSQMLVLPPFVSLARAKAYNLSSA